MYYYRAKIVKVVDGDTVDLIVDLGFNVSVKERFRLYGINTPETRTRDKEEKEKGLLAKARLQELIDNCDGDLRIETKKDKKGKFGRYLAVLHDGINFININDVLLLEGHAVEYMIK